MKKILITLIFVSVWMGMSNVWSEEIVWLSTYEDAIAASKSLDQPIMIDFYTDWCRWCKELDKTTYQDANVVALSNEFVCAKVDAEGRNFDRGLLRKYKITGYPAILFLNSDGLVIGEVRGYLPAMHFLPKMKQSLNTYNDLADAKKTIKTNPNDPKAAYQIGHSFFSSGDFDKAEDYLLRVVEHDPDNDSGFLPDAILELGVLYGQSNQLDKALDYFSQFTERFTLHERRHEALYFTGLSFYLLENFEMAKKSFEMVVELYPQSPYAEQAQKVLQQMGY